MTPSPEINRQDQLIGRAQALKEMGQVVNQCIEDDSGIDGIIRWLRTAAEELDSEILLQKREAGA
jgi:hypothetical protein